MLKYCPEGATSAIVYACSFTLNSSAHLKPSDVPKPFICFVRWMKPNKNDVPL